MGNTLTGNESGMVMPVQPMNAGYGYGGGYPVLPMLYSGNNGGGGLFGGNGGDSWLGILFLIALCNGGLGGLGGIGGGYGGAMMGSMMGLGYDFPWLLAGQNNINNNVSDGFRDAQLHDSVTSVRDGISDLSTQLCQCCGDMRYDMANGLNGVNMNVSNGFASLNTALCNGFNGVNNSVFGAQTAIAQQMNANELANLNRSFAEQTANAQGFNNVNAGVADLRYTVATEACADRAAVGDALQNVTMQNVQSTNALMSTIRDGIQSIKDDLCQDRLDAERRENQNLRTQLNMAQLQASQTAQTARLLENNNAQTAIFQQGLNNEVDALYNRLQQCPVNSVPVYGSQPIFTCNNNGGCPCNGGNF